MSKLARLKHRESATVYARTGVGIKIGRCLFRACRLRTRHP